MSNNRRLNQARRALERLNADELHTVLADMAQPGVYVKLSTIDPANIPDNGMFAGNLVRATLDIQFSEGFEAGRDAAWDTILSYFVPVHGSKLQIDYLVNYISGIVAAGFGELPKAQLEELATELTRALSTLDIRLAKMREVIDVATQTGDLVDLTSIHALYEAIKNYVSGTDRNGDMLRTLINSHDGINAREFDLRKHFKPGAKHRKEPHVLWIANAASTKKEEHPGFTWDKITDALLDDLRARQPTLNTVEQRALEALEDSDDPLNLVRLYYRRCGKHIVQIQEGGQKRF